MWQAKTGKLQIWGQFELQSEFKPSLDFYPDVYQINELGVVVSTYKSRTQEAYWKIAKSLRLAWAI